MEVFKINKISHFIQWGLVGLITISCFLLMFNASVQESATMDELAHIPAGYSYVRYLDYRLNPEHPPLIKALAGFPLLFLNSFGTAQNKLNFPIESSAWQKDINGQWTIGAQFLYESSNDADKIIQWARLGPMILTLLLVVFIYFWAKKLIGAWWALIPTSLFAFSPTVLAHGHYVTTDVGAVLGIFIASYYFIKFLWKPSRRNLIIAGLIFGFAQLTKFSAVLIIPFFIFLAILFCLWKIRNEWQNATIINWPKRLFGVVIRYCLALIGIFVIGYLVVYAAYFLFTFNYPIEKQGADTEFTLASFAQGPDPDWETCKLNSDVGLGRRIRCLAEINIWMSQNKILRPLAQYLLGVLMVMQRSAGGNTAYFLSEVSASGWWYYFPVVFVLKEPLPSLILITFALILALWRIFKSFKTHYSLVKSFFDYLGLHFAEVSMLIFIILYWAYSIKSPLNIGVRHVLPTMPFVYILSVSALKKWAYPKKFFPREGFLRKILFLALNFLRATSKKILIAFLIIWYFTEALLASPYFLSYFNQFAGGTDNGYRYVVDSNYDWGQDLKRLKKFVENPPAGEDIQKIAVDYFGGGNPKYYLGDKAESWWSAKGNPAENEITWLAISVNTLQAALGKLHPGQLRNPEDEYQWLTKIKNPYEPDFRAGKSIFIYKL